MIFVAGISIALFISALLLVKKEKSSSDVYLFLWMLLNAVHLSFFYLFYTERIYDYPVLLGLQFPMPLLHGVLLYFYVSSVTNRFPKNKWVAMAHFLPSIATLLYLIHFFILPAEQKIEIFKNEGREYALFQRILLLAVFISGIVYVVVSSLMLRDHKKRIRNEFSNIEHINLKWLRFLTYGLGVIWSLVIFVQNDVLIFMGISVFVILVGFFGVQQKNIFAATALDKVKDEPLKTEETVVKEKYISSGLSEEKEEKYYKQLSRLMLEEKVYTNAELSLSDLAAKLDIHSNYLSQIINKKEDKSFYDYIGYHRVEEFKKLMALPENQQFTLMAIAYDCGFNSKSSFNRYFKKITGETPSQYVKGVKA